MADRKTSSRAAPSDAGDPGQRDESLPEAQHDGTDGTIPVGGPSLADRDNVDSQRLIQETKDAVQAVTDAANTEPAAEADFGGSGEKRTLKTAGPYMIMDPTTGVEVVEEAREVEMSAFLQNKIDDGLIVEG